MARKTSKKTSKKGPSQSEIREEVTTKILDGIANGKFPWRCPWDRDSGFIGGGMPRNAVSGKQYRGINPMLLLCSDYENPHWATYKQWGELGGQVRRGEKGEKVVFYTVLNKVQTTSDGQEIIEEDGEPATRKIFLLRYYTVFNFEQVEYEDDKLDRFKPKPEKPVSNGEDLAIFEPAERFIKATGADFRHGGTRAFYCPPSPQGSWPDHTDGDFVKMPEKHRFKGDDAVQKALYYYKTSLHELSHWAEVRVGWGRDSKKDNYAMGELIAEISACYLATHLGVPLADDFSASLGDSAAYLKSWLSKMRDDSQFIFTAANQASKVADYLLQFHEQVEDLGGGTIKPTTKTKKTKTTRSKGRAA